MHADGRLLSGSRSNSPFPASPSYVTPPDDKERWRPSDEYMSHCVDGGVQPTVACRRQLAPLCQTLAAALRGGDDSHTQTAAHDRSRCVACFSGGVVVMTASRAGQHPPPPPTPTPPPLPPPRWRQSDQAHCCASPVFCGAVFGRVCPAVTIDPLPDRSE